MPDSPVLQSTRMADPFDLQRFVDAQRSIYADVVAELRRGEKRSHWMWFIFPQLAGLGHSSMAQTYAIGSIAEARVYLDHPILGARLRECTRLVCAVDNRTIHQIFGSPDDLKFRSSMTLFARAAPEEAVFEEALAKYFAGEPDPRTLQRL
ncbi:MAG: amino calpastatin [Acidobacteria bacterium]|nr:amino calpastatin [Acidobacteriota bacterium]